MQNHAARQAVNLEASVRFSCFENLLGQVDLAEPIDGPIMQAKAMSRGLAPRAAGVEWWVRCGASCAVFGFAPWRQLDGAGPMCQLPGVEVNQCQQVANKKKLITLLDLCVSSLRRGHANLLCVVPILTDDPRRESTRD